MNRLCSNNPCFLSEEQKTQIEIPLIYQNPQQFYFPYEMPNPAQLDHRINSRNQQFGHTISPKYNERGYMRTNNQAESSFWGSQDYSRNSNLNTDFKKLPYLKKEVKENIPPTYPRPNLKEECFTSNKIYFNNELARSKSFQKDQQTAIKSNLSVHNFSQIYPDKHLYQNAAHFDIVPVSQYNSLLQSNMSMKKIIEQEYRPLRTCYESLRQQQRQRQKLILMLQHKVKQLGQKLKQHSVSSMNYARY